MTAADRLRAAVEAALVCSEHPSGHIEACEACEACSWFATASSAALAAVQPIVEEAQVALDLERRCRDANKLAVVQTVGGAVDGAPTDTGNYLQRLRELVEIEACAAEAQAEIARLRAVLEWVASRSGASRRNMIAGFCLGSIQDVTEAAVAGDWPAVRAAGVVLPGEEG